MYWFPPNDVKQSGNTIMKGFSFCWCIKRSIRSGTLSSKFFQFTRPRPLPVKPARSNKTGNFLFLFRAELYCQGMYTGNVLMCGSPRRLPFKIFEVCSKKIIEPFFMFVDFFSITWRWSRNGGVAYALASI